MGDFNIDYNKRFTVDYVHRHLFTPNLYIHAYCKVPYCTQNVHHNHTIFIVNLAVKAYLKMDNHEGSEKKPKMFKQNKLYLCHSLQ